ncbi:Uncharacterized protein Fot_23120 [Forsythia ovata]|uniref:Uncharacterized protein n=1 Tax=Forsythia ovata TaxID=205694 RepID=A0ABD1UZM2_9LAMI
MYRTNFGIGHSIKDLLDTHISPGDDWDEGIRAYGAKDFEVKTPIIIDFKKQPTRAKISDNQSNINHMISYEGKSNSRMSKFDEKCATLDEAKKNIILKKVAAGKISR